MSRIAPWGSTVALVTAIAAIAWGSDAVFAWTADAVFAWAMDCGPTCTIEPAATIKVIPGVSEQDAFQALGCDSIAELETGHGGVYQFAMANGDKFIVSVVDGRVDAADVLPGSE